MEPQAALPQKTPYSWPAILSFPAGLMMCFSWGTLGIVLGAIGLWQTRAGRRRGRKWAACGLAMGCLSLLFVIAAFPATFYNPPIRWQDRQMQAFLDDVAAGRWDQAQANPLCRYVGDPAASTQAVQPPLADSPDQDASVSNIPREEFRAWAKFFRARHGRGRILFAHHHVGGGDRTSFYTVRFERAPLRSCELWYPDQPNGLYYWFGFGFVEDPQRRLPGGTALHWAAMVGHPAAVEELVRQGEDVNAPDADGQTPLDVAQRRARYWEGKGFDPGIIEVLIRHGGRSGREDRSSTTAPDSGPLLPDPQPAITAGPPALH